MKRKPIKYYRLYFAATAVMVLVLAIGALAQTLAFFSKGANRATALNLVALQPALHVPALQWLPDDHETGRQIEDFNKSEITKQYLYSWYQRHISYLNGDTTSIKDYFTSSALEKIKHEIKLAHNGQFLLQQADLDHHIRWHFFSADGQLAAFTDENMVVKQRIYDRSGGQKIYAGDYVAGYDVVMILTDGRWRIRAMKSRPVSDTLKTADVLPDKTGMIQLKHTTFHIDGKTFIPKGVNYYPQRSPWKLFWQQYDSNVIKKDLDLIHSMGFNTIRVFVGFHEFNKGNVPASRLLQLKNLLDMASAREVKVIVTLFDFMGDYRLLNFSATDRQLETLLRAFSTHKALFAWDIKNEPDLDFNYHAPDDVKEWLSWILERARRYDPNHLLTIGWAFPEHAALFADQVDFVSFHSYKSPAELADGIGRLHVQVPHKALVLEEFGCPTYRGVWAPTGKNEEDQVEYFSKVRQVLQQNGNIPFLVWTLYDFTEVPSEVVGRLPWHKKPQQHFGIIRENGKPKPGAAALLR